MFIWNNVFPFCSSPPSSGGSARRICRPCSPAFALPYDRQGLADYLGVDRSAMSAELSKLRRDGVLDCKGKHVTLYKPDPPCSKS